MVEHDYAFRSPRELRQYVVLVAEVDENNVFSSYIRWLLAVDTRYKLDISPKGFANYPCCTEAIGAVAVVDAHGFRFVFRHDFVLTAKTAHLEFGGMQR